MWEIFIDFKKNIFNKRMKEVMLVLKFQDKISKKKIGNFRDFGFSFSCCVVDWIRKPKIFSLIASKNNVCAIPNKKRASNMEVKTGIFNF